MHTDPQIDLDADLGEGVTDDAGLLRSSRAATSRA